MKSIILRALVQSAAVLVMAMTFGGCANVPYESAMEWMQKQPQRLDP
jgi:hypothetical protein